MSNRTVMPEQPFYEQREVLAREVVKSVEAVYKAKADLDSATKSKKDTAPFKAVLAETRIAERKAVAALNAHRKEHGY
jgi:hypothetical protein